MMETIVSPWPTRVYVLIPAYNAADSLGRVIDDLRGSIPVDHIMVVDDASRDDPGAICTSRGIECIRHEKNQGKGAALITGFTALRERGAEWIVTLDADGQHAVADLPVFLDSMAGSTKNGIIIGCRDMRPGVMPLSRICSNRITSVILSLITGASIRDSQCGYRAYRTVLFDRMTITYKRFEMETEVIIKGVRLGFGIGFVPIRTLYQGEKSNISHVADTIRWIRAVLRIWMGTNSIVTVHTAP